MKRNFEGQEIKKKGKKDKNKIKRYKESTLLDKTLINYREGEVKSVRGH